jgi:hypothetical protein
VVPRSEGLAESLSERSGRSGENSKFVIAVAAVTSFAVAERLPFNALAAIWEPRQLLFLPILYTLFALPFFGAATCIGLALATFPDRIGRIYRYDFSMRAVSAYWGHLTAKSSETSTNGLDRSESRR